jgi:putative NIF3 family GTP cyclohydrolase 1 type 2
MVYVTSDSKNSKYGTWAILSTTFITWEHSNTTGLMVQQYASAMHSQCNEYAPSTF